MNQKSFLFVGSWMQPLKTLPVQQRWNVVEAIVEYSTSGKVSDALDPMETIAFGFIRNEIDRMHNRRNEVCEKRRVAATARWGRNKENAEQPDANGCNAYQADAPYDKESESNSGSVSGSEPESTKTPSSMPKGVRVKGNAGNAKRYDESELLGRFFDASNQAKLEAIAMQHHVGISDLRRMAEEITIQWALTEKTHGSYHDASTHLIFALGEKANRERKSRLQAIADGTIIPATKAKGMLGIDEYIDGQGRRTYNGVDFIPQDAPPRPGRAFYWNQTTQSWDDIQ